MTLGIVIVNYNTREQTLECLASVAAEAPEGTEVVLVDNGSVDGSAEAIRAAYPTVTVVDAGGNVGFARGVNLGAAATRADLVLLLNPDTVVLPGSLHALVAFASAHPEYGVYGGRTLRPDGSTDPSSCWGAPTLWSLTCFALGLSTAFKRSRVFDPESLGTWDRDTVRVVPIITGCLLLIRHADWDRVGGMDETFFLYGEDAEFAHRTRAAGLASVVVPDAVIIHEVGGSTASGGRKMSMVMAGKTTLLRRTWSPSAAAVGVALLAAGSGLRALLERVAGRPGTWIEVWGSRRKWLPGYPEAKTALFGILA